MQNESEIEADWNQINDSDSVAYRWLILACKKAKVIVIGAVGYDTIAITRKYSDLYTCIETIDLAVESYIDRGLITVR